MKKQTGFALIASIAGIIVIAAVVVAGVLVYRHNHKSNPANSNSQQTANKPTTNTKTQSQASDPYAGWKTYCDSASKNCFKYPPDWSLSSSSVQGGVSVSVRNSGNTVLANYTNPLVKDSGTGDFYTTSIDTLADGSSDLKVLGGIFSANNLPSYYLVDTSTADNYSVVSGQSSQFPTAVRYTDKSSGEQAQFTAYLIGSGYSDIDKSKTWFTTNDAKTSLLILQSFYYE